MPKVVHVDSETGFSGGEVQVFLLIEALAKRGIDNVLVCPPGSRAESEARKRGVEVFTVRMRNDLALGGVVRMTSWLRDSGADLVHLHTGRATWLGGLAARRASIPAITTRRMDRTVKRGFRTRLMYGSFVRETVAISPAVRDCLIEGGVDERSIRLIWDAVDPEAFRSERPRADVRAELGFGPEDFVLLSMAALVRRKGMDVLIRALAELHARGRASVRLAIGGEGEEREALGALTEELGHAEHVRFLGWRDDKHDLLAAADAFVLPSRREGVGVAALEAMAAGKPVVASRVGGLSQAVIDMESGLLVEPEDPEALADGIERIATDSALLWSLATGGRERVLAHFSIESQASQYVEAYNRALGMEVFR